MANKKLFSSAASKSPKTDTYNQAGGRAYSLKSTHALAQLAATGCLTETFYARADTQLDNVLDLCRDTDPQFIAKTALYARKHGYMKDMPALLCAYLSTVDTDLLSQVFPQVINNGKMLRNFVQIMRSGVVGRKSLGSAPKRCVTDWLTNRDDDSLFRDSVGNDPSLKDVVKLVHPRPANKTREALYAYLLGRKHTKRNLPKIVKQYEAFKTSDTVQEVPNVPFQMLTSWDLDTSVWEAIIKNAGWHMIRMNLNTFERHGVFKDKKLVKMVVDKLRDEKLIKRSRVFPYQLLMAYTMYDGMHEVKEALQDAMEISVSNVPKIDGKVLIFPDVSGSMGSPVTGYRQGATSAVQCVDVAALVSSVFLHHNKSAEVYPFATKVHSPNMNPRDSIITNAQKLSKYLGGGTNCAAPLYHVNQQNIKADLCIMVSDNQSWVSLKHGGIQGWGGRMQGSYEGYPTDTMEQWKIFKRRNKKAKLVCLDVQPGTDTQAPENKSVLNVGGFSDAVFDIISEFYTGNLNVDHWVGLINDLEV